jgi:hypothetical protein
MGGGIPASKTLKGSTLETYCPDYDMEGLGDSDFLFYQYTLLADVLALCKRDSNLILVQLPIQHITEGLKCDELRNMVILHNIHCRANNRKPALKALFVDHTCEVCSQYVLLFSSHDIISSRRQHD